MTNNQVRLFLSKTSQKTFSDHVASYVFPQDCCEASIEADSGLQSWSSFMEANRITSPCTTSQLDEYGRTTKGKLTCSPIGEVVNKILAIDRRPRTCRPDCLRYSSEGIWVNWNLEGIADASI